MKICTFCGYQTDNMTRTCTSCGSKQFNYVCPNCSNEFEGKFCPTCGTKFDAVARICPDCGRKYFSKSCPDCGYNGTKKTPVRTATAPLAPMDRKALTAFSLSISGFMTFLFPLLLAGLIMGIKGRKQPDLDDRSRNYYNIAFALGIVGIFLNVCMFMVYVVYFGASIISRLN